MKLIIEYKNFDSLMIFRIYNNFYSLCKLKLVKIKRVKIIKRHVHLLSINFSSC